METIEKNGVRVELKRTALTGGQVSNLVREAIKIYRDGEFLDDYAFNPVDMEINFFAGLFYFTVEGYNMEDNDKFEELFCAGIHQELLDKIVNAKEAYDLMWKTAKEVGNSIGGILGRIDRFISSMPSEGDLKELADKLPGEWKDAVNQYNDIIGKRSGNEISGGDIIA